MIKRSAILNKKLNELESEIGDVFRLPPHLDSSEILFHHLQKRFIYLKNLLTAEIASSPENADDQLRQIGAKLARLEAAANEYRTRALNDDTPPPPVNSRCSTHTFLHDDNGDGDASNLEGKKLCMDENNHVKREEWEGRIGKYCGVFGSGMIIGAICCSLFIFDSSHFLHFFETLHFVSPIPPPT